MSTTDILATQRRKLIDELAQVRARAVAIEAEITALDTALSALPPSEGKPVQLRPVSSPSRSAGGGRKMSVKAMVLDALEKHFPDGASALDLLDCFADVYGRDDVARTSLSPQLTTLKKDGKIERDGMTWRLVSHG